MGYQTYVAPVPATGTTAFLAMTGETLSFGNAIGPIEERIGQI